jgi:hypothetical protein
MSSGVTRHVLRSFDLPQTFDKDQVAGKWISQEAVG